MFDASSDFKEQLERDIADGSTAMSDVFEW